MHLLGASIKVELNPGTPQAKVLSRSRAGTSTGRRTRTRWHRPVDGEGAATCFARHVPARHRASGWHGEHGVPSGRRATSSGARGRTDRDVPRHPAGHARLTRPLRSRHDCRDEDADLAGLADVPRTERPRPRRHSSRPARGGSSRSGARDRRASSTRTGAEGAVDLRRLAMRGGGRTCADVVDAQFVVRRARWLDDAAAELAGARRRPNVARSPAGAPTRSSTASSARSSSGATCRASRGHGGRRDDREVVNCDARPGAFRRRETRRLRGRRSAGRP